MPDAILTRRAPMSGRCGHVPSPASFAAILAYQSEAMLGHRVDTLAILLLLLSLSIARRHCVAIALIKGGIGRSACAIPALLH